MAAPSETYVDPSIAANSGTGTIGDPYGDLQYALDTMTRDATNGDRINIKSGTAEVLTGTIDLTSYGSAGLTNWITFQGYDSVAGDGGIGAIDGNNGNFSILGAAAYVLYSHLKLFNTGTAVVVSMGNRTQMIRCEISQSSTGGVTAGSTRPEWVSVNNCYFHDIAGYGVDKIRKISNCYFANGVTNKFTNAISAVVEGGSIRQCIFNLDGSSNGIGGSYANITDNNSFLSTTGTGAAIISSVLHAMSNNLIEGFSGTGGRGLSLAQADAGDVTHNAFYDCATNINYAAGVDIIGGEDNETLSASPFAKTGSLPTDFTSATFWSDLYAYFAPVDTGNVYSGFPVGSNHTKGAVGQPVGGGAGGGLLRVNMNGNVFG